MNKELSDRRLATKFGYDNRPYVAVRAVITLYDYLFLLKK